MSEPSKSGLSKPELSKPEPSKPGLPKPEPSKPELPKSEPSKSGLSKSDLEVVAARLRDVVRNEPEAVAVAADQLAAENAVAAGVAALAGEEAPQQASAASGKPSLVKDLLITVELVMRALTDRG